MKNISGNRQKLDKCQQKDRPEGSPHPWNVSSRPRNAPRNPFLKVARPLSTNSTYGSSRHTPPQGEIRPGKAPQCQLKDLRKGPWTRRTGGNSMKGVERRGKAVKDARTSTGTPRQQDAPSERAWPGRALESPRQAPTEPLRRSCGGVRPLLLDTPSPPRRRRHPVGRTRIKKGPHDAGLRLIPVRRRRSLLETTEHRGTPPGDHQEILRDG